jgi:hypothetical protein
MQVRRLFEGMVSETTLTWIPGLSQYACFSRHIRMDSPTQASPTSFVSHQLFSVLHAPALPCIVVSFSSAPLLCPSRYGMVLVNTFFGQDVLLRTAPTPWGPWVLVFLVLCLLCSTSCMVCSTLLAPWGRPVVFARSCGLTRIVLPEIVTHRLNWRHTHRCPSHRIIRPSHFTLFLHHFGPTVCPATHSLTVATLTFSLTCKIKIS